MAPADPPGLHRLIYASKIVGVLPAHQLDRILLRAQAYNPSAGITGLLLLHEGTFLQCIEGPEAGVAGVMQRIRRDRRHAAIVMLESGPCASRAFPDTAMGYVAPRNLSDGQRAGFINVMAASRDSARPRTGAEHSFADHVWSFLGGFRKFEAA
ncbi:MAG: BLUF domain-containing protein [Alphaproteobacteria bacterium]